MRILVTGAAGFIGYHLTKALLKRGDTVMGLDNLNPYYDVNLKKARLADLKNHASFQFVKCDLSDRKKMTKLFERSSFDMIAHLAAQAGVRYSLTAPYAYIDSNLVGFAHILEGARHQAVKHLIFASSSSVYGANTKYPFSENDPVDHPIALYAATKKANELMAHSYATLFNIPCTGLRFFTVYGPWGRPDMALFKFTKNILAGTPIEVYNHGNMARDFTYIDDIIQGTLLALDHPPLEHPPYRIYNIGNNNPVSLLHFIETLEKILNKSAVKKLLPLQPGDVPETYADISQLMALGYQPQTTLQEGIQKFVAWYQEYFS